LSQDSIETALQQARSRLRPRESIQQDKYTRDNYLSYMATKALPDAPPPESYTDAMFRPDRNDWHAAMLEEMGAVWANNTYKYDPAGRIEKHKARIVVKGFGQRYGLDFHETFSPTAKMKSVKVLLAIAAVKNYEAVHLDVSTAFLNGTLREEVFMDQPEGFEDGTDRICRLKRTLELKRAFADLGLEPSPHDSSVFISTDGSEFYIGVWVDDMLVIAPTMDEIKSFLGRSPKSWACG